MVRRRHDAASANRRRPNQQTIALAYLCIRAEGYRLPRRPSHTHTLSLTISVDRLHGSLHVFKVFYLLETLIAAKS